MRTCLSGLGLVASLSLLSACGGGSSGTVNPPTPNAAPVANAGPNQTVTGSSTVTLDGSASSDSDGSVASYAWTQTAGATVTLSSTTVAKPTFTAPATSDTLTFSLTVTDNRGANSAAASVSITVNGAAVSTVTGQINYVRIPFSSTLRNGLDYTNPLNKPARGVTVNAVAAGTTTPVLATATTDANGNYSLSNIPASTSINIQVVAQMVKTGTLPNWNFTVRDLPATLTTTPNPLPDIYVYTDGVAFTPSSATHNIVIPSGYSTAASPTVTGTRASAPFAILDTVYQAVQLVTSAKSDANFPTLVLDWGTNNLADDGTFYTSAPLQHIVLAGDLTADTDEFDQHVIAHEFGHYIEHNFSRADNIGGSHGLGDKLDPRVAFGEGFGYAFGAMVLNDPVTRDSFIDTTPGHSLNCPSDQCSSTFNVENNPATNPPAANDNYGCWCSESSVWSILWDVYDAAPDANDTLSLGFVPIWNVLTTDQKITPAFTTIFSFITALKAQNASSAAAIDTLVGAQNISAVVDAYGTGESHYPTTVFTNNNLAVLPIYTTMTVGGPQAVLRTVNDAGPDSVDNSGNKLGDHRFIRFNTPAFTGRKITANSSNPNTGKDVDFKVFRSTPFGFATSGEDPPDPNGQSATFDTSASDYLIDVYDCANGCDTSEGTPGDYDLTVAIQ